MNDESIWQKHIIERAAQFEKLFGQAVWKQALYPWLKSLRDLHTKEAIYGKHSEADRATHRGMVMAFEQMMNLPQAIESYQDQQRIKREKEAAGVKENGPVRDATDYAESVFDAPQWED